MAQASLRSSGFAICTNNEAAASGEESLGMCHRKVVHSRVRGTILNGRSSVTSLLHNRKIWAKLPPTDDERHSHAVQHDRAAN